MDLNATSSIDAQSPSAFPYFPGAIVPLSRAAYSGGLVVFEFGPSTSTEPFPISPIAQHTLGLATAGSSAVEAHVGGTFYRRHIVAGGSCVLIPAGTSSEWRFCDGEVAGIAIFIGTDLLSRFVLEPLELDRARVLIRPELFFEDPLLYQLGLGIASILRSPSQLEMRCLDSLTRALITQLLVHHAWMLPHVTPVRGRIPQPTLKRVLDYIESQPAADLRLGQLAELAHISPYHFARLFTRTVGRPLHQYVLERRLNLACRLLRDTDLAIAQIAVEAGFSDESHLLRRFKAYYHVTPSAVRKERKNLP